MARDSRLTPPVSTRYPASTLDRLRTLAQAGQETVSGLIQRYVEEGSRVDEHPGIVFRAGPAGRRAGLAGGPDVWEVVALVREFAEGADAEVAVERAAQWLSIGSSQVRSALGYYGAFPDEIEGQSALNRQASEAAERALTQVARAGA